MEGKRFLVTGAASGIGKETSILLSKLGASVLLVDCNSDGLEKLENEIGSKHSYSLTLDLSQPSEIRKAITDAVENFGKLNGLAHIAGLPYIAPLKAVKEDKADQLYKVNQYACIELSKSFIHNRLQKKEEAIGNSIVFVSSVYGVVGSAANVAYAMTKAAVIGITKALAIELAPKRIRVNCVAPGFIKSNMMSENSFRFDEDYMNKLNTLHPLGLGEPIDIANTIVFLLSEMSKWTTGAVFNIDGGFTAQ